MLAWELAQEQWRDAKSQQFAHTHILPIPEQVALGRDAMAQLDRVLKKIQHDCE